MFAASKTKRVVAAATTDPFFPYVPLLLETTSTNGQQNNTFLDSSASPNTLTRTGTPTQGSVTPYWPDGYWSNNFSGSGQYLNIPYNSAFDLAAGDFTIEFWVNTTSTAAYATGIRLGDSGAGNWIIYVNDLNGNGNVGFWSVTLSFAVTTSGALVNNGLWNHVAVTRIGSVFTIYINGVSRGTTTVAGSLGTTTQQLWIARDSSNVRELAGYLSNVRIIKGQALATGNFTPPTSPLTKTTVGWTGANAASSLTGTVSLLTCQSNRFLDNSTNNFTITATGTPKVQAFQPFSPTASYTTALYGGNGYFNGSTDYLSTASSSAFTFGTADFTVEYWVYCPSLPGPFTILCGGNLSSATDIGFGFNPSSPYCTHNTNWPVYTSTAMPTNAWTHLAFTRTSGTWKLYMNGVDVTTGSQSNPNVTTATLGIGATSGGTSKFIGYICNLRVVKGVAVYTGAFTPPTLAPITTAGSTSAASYSSTTNVNTSFAASSTSLLTNFTNAGIYDAAVQNNAITVGDAQASTTQFKWSPTSMKYDGTGDWLTAIDNPQLQLGTGDFTIDGWVYLSAIGVAYGIISKGTATTGWSVNVTSGNKLQFSYTASNLTGATSLASATWYYFAVVRSGSATGNLKVYLNGTADATSGGAVTDSFTQTNTLYVGADRVGGSALNGYLQDVRITRYARTITTPTAAFPTR